MTAEVTMRAVDANVELKKEDHSATIIVPGKVVYRFDSFQLDEETRQYCRLAVHEYYRRTKIIRRLKNADVVKTTITNPVFLVVTSFDRRANEKDEAIKQLKCCFSSYQNVPKENIFEVREFDQNTFDTGTTNTPEAEENRLNFEGTTDAIKVGKLPSKVIIAGSKPTLFGRSPLLTHFKRKGIPFQYLDSDQGLLAGFTF